MSITLASTWHPRGEDNRFLRLLPLLTSHYQELIIVVPGDSAFPVAENSDKYERLTFYVARDWSWGRHLSLELALRAGTSHIHYADFDRLLRWVETRPTEWQQGLELLQQCECMIMGRSEASCLTHPKSLLHTEAISNRVVSYLVGKSMDFSAGSKGFNREATAYLVSKCLPGKAIGTDGEWPVILHRGGFKLDYLEVDGLDWEIPDQYQKLAASRMRQQHLADVYDADPRHWEHRSAIALEIVECALAASIRD